MSERTATFEIQGMVCEMGCGASLRKGLYTTDAVSEVKVKYEEDRKENVIEVFYDANQTSPEKMEKIIESLNDGQFTAELRSDRAAKKKNLNKKQSANFSPSNERREGLEASNANNFSFPNLTELLNSLIY